MSLRTARCSEGPCGFSFARNNARKTFPEGSNERLVEKLEKQVGG
jgi:hypothetical protein